jgi:hypothetical protein
MRAGAPSCVTHLHRRDDDLDTFRQLLEVRHVLDDHPPGAEPDAVEVVRGGVDRVRRGAVEADCRHAAVDQRACSVGVRVAPAGPVRIAPPVARVVAVQEHDVSAPDAVELRRQLVGGDRAWRSPRNVDRHRVGDETVEGDVVECVAARDLVRRCVDVRADVVEQVVLRHRVAVLLYLGDRREGRIRQARKDRHPVLVVVRQVDDPHGGDSVVAQARCE